MIQHAPFAYDLAAYIRYISKYINLERLDGVTVAFEYKEALNTLDRGFQPSEPLIATSSQEIVGVAMTPLGAVDIHFIQSTDAAR